MILYYSFRMSSELTPLPCPECRLAGHNGRVGSRRNMCTTCNNFAQNVMRLTRMQLKALHPDEYETIRARVELDLYPQVIEDFSIKEGLPR